MSTSAPLLRVEHPVELQELLQGLCEPGGASLIFGEGEPLPVLVDIAEGDHLLIDVTAVAEIAPEVEKDNPMRLLGQASGAMLTTSPLVFREWVAEDRRRRFRCEYPAYAEVLHRRDSFRAELRSGMEVAVELHAEPPTDTSQAPVDVSGTLKNLSRGGCLIEAPLAAAMKLDPGQRIDVLELGFPNRQRLRLTAHLRHMQHDAERQLARLGCEFVNLDAGTERRLWFYVREIEREGARKALQDERTLSPSALFEREGLGVGAGPRPHGADYPTPMARRLAKVAAYLSAELLALLEGGEVDAIRLSRHSDLLLGLIEEDAQAVLFGTVCLVDEPLLVQHGIAVAARLAMLGRANGLPRDVCKALVASALVHDLGKALLPSSLRRAMRRSRPLNEAQRQALGEHVELLMARLAGCRWLSAMVSQAVIAGINERLDGSGYPQARKGDAVEGLSRMAAVVDVVDAMGRPRPDRPARSISETYRFLLANGQAFDKRWVQNYVSHFGVMPVGSLVRFSSGELAWVQRVARNGHLVQVQATPRAVLPGDELGEVLVEGQLARLGKPEAMVVPQGSREMPLF